MATIFKNKLAAIRKELQLVADTAPALGVAFTIRNAIGKQLDEIGRLFKVERTTGESDIAYRLRILNAYKYASDCGTIDAVIIATETYTGKKNAILREIRSAGIEIKFIEQGYTIPAGSERQVKKHTAAGVDLIILLEPETTTSFRFETNGQGFDNQGKFINGYTA